MARLRAGGPEKRSVEANKVTPGGAPGRRVANTPASRTSVPNSSELGDSSEDEIVVHGDLRNIRSLKEVSIPVMAPKKGAKASAVTSPTDSISSSAGSTPRATSADYDTPGTTPATSVLGNASTKRKRSQLAKNVVKVEDSEDEEDVDAALAMKLQQEEYAFEAGPNKRAKAAKRAIGDSEDQESELSELDSVESLDLKLVRKQGRKGAQIFGQKVNKGKRAMAPPPAPTRGKKTRLPSRSARRKSRLMIDSAPLKIDDSDASDLEELSELGSEDEFVEESEAVSAGASETESEVALVSSRESTVAPGLSSSRLSRGGKKRTGGGRGRGRRRFGRLTEEDGEEIARQITKTIQSGLLSRKERERKKLEKSHPTIKTMWNTLGQQPIIKPVAAAQPQSITRRLKPFQLEGLDWLIRQEKTHYKGGLLGDEMGMGKTIQAVSLIMSDYPQKEPTLVVVPPVALMQWSTEIAEYTDGKLKVLVYHGQNSKVKSMSLKELKKYDVIMISYNSLESLHRKETKGWSRGEDIIKEDSPIHAIHFHRLILDEAHSIKSRTTGVAKACFALDGTYKWCLSGTPVQNRIGEFFSLLRFLEVRPFADYFCKRCPCSKLHWKLDEDHMCESCKHSGMEHVSVFNQELLNPLTQSEDPEDRSKAMDKLHMITARIMLRRMKRDYVSSMGLPPKEVIVHNEFFGEIERDFSSSIMSNTARQFDTYVARGVMLNNYANIFGLIMQMRQVANHPDLLLKKHASEGQNVLVCNICDEVAEEAIRSQCKHDFCRTCVKSYMQSVEDNGGDADCPRCHIPLSIDLDAPEIEQDEEDVKKSSIINRIKMENWTSSTKIEMLVYDLYKLRSKKQTLKSIVFSQFTSMLQLIEWRLRRAGFNTVMLDGSMTPIQRQKSIEHFMNNPDVEVFLVSLKAGGVALNLTEASRVFIVDPWWNPAAEWQSADRCHRIGQKRPCVITRLCIEDSVESRMVMLQEKKANMINGTINNDKTSMEKLTPEDMQFLFRGT
ncbi:DNA repair protein rad16 [Vermiconidia calcicola]|uniref:DNA repair protein rad16 n=1 Tax=Vermiconidia calcicola TaxID=1690605 RepID=A0ACC3NCI5_9PEZI|nr:DNA repair protein rad16 [Vermiconidia calcicola]